MNYYMKRWDTYVDSSLVIGETKLIMPERQIIKFKDASEEAYVSFRELAQLVDTSRLYAESIQYNKRTLIAAFQYLLIGKHYGQFNEQEIVQEFPSSSLFILEDKQGFNAIFKQFLKAEFNYELSELLPALQFAAKFFILIFSYDLPQVAQKRSQALLQVRTTGM